MIAAFNDGRIMVPFSAYAGSNSGIPIEALTTTEFHAAADALFGFSGTEKQARTVPGWLTIERVDPLMNFCQQVAIAYRAALSAVSVDQSLRRLRTFLRQQPVSNAHRACPRRPGPARTSAARRGRLWMPAATLPRPTDQTITPRQVRNRPVSNKLSSIPPAGGSPPWTVPDVHLRSTALMHGGGASLIWQRSVVQVRLGPPV